MDSHPGRERTERASRRHVRLGIQLRFAGGDGQGQLVNLSATGMHVRMPPSQMSELPRCGDQAHFQFRLSGQAHPIEGMAELVWLNTNDRDPDGTPSLGFGLKVVTLADDPKRRLEAYLSQFRYTVLVVDDDPVFLALMTSALGGHYHVVGCTSGEEALQKFAETEVSVLTVDQNMEGMHGLELLMRISREFPRSPTERIVLSRHAEVDQIRSLINQGKIFAYLKKPVQRDELLQVVNRAVASYALTMENHRLQEELERANQKLREENAHLRQRLGGLSGFDNIAGHSAEMRRALMELERVRSSEVTVHIEGETGTGKELVARALHFGGPRASGPFFAQNCGGISETLLQSTLFGHRKGAFTGADRDHPGVFQLADGGTLFLDEVAELPLVIQASILRALQEREVMPLGGTRPVKVNVRIISATHKDLRQEVRRGTFREDLYFRLVVMSVRLPPLRERRGDIPLLARHFLDLQCEAQKKNVPGFSAESIQLLERYPWPGNVRELENEVERLVVLADDGAKIPASTLSPHIRDATPEPALAAAHGHLIPEQLTYDAAIETLERAMVERALSASGGVVSRAAEQLGVERTRLVKIRRRLGISS